MSCYLLTIKIFYSMVLRFETLTGVWKDQNCSVASPFVCRRVCDDKETAKKLSLELFLMVFGMVIAMILLLILWERRLNCNIRENNNLANHLA